MHTPESIRSAIAMLLAERATIKRRNREIARKLHVLRVKLARLGVSYDETITQPMDSGPDPFADLDSILGDE